MTECPKESLGDARNDFGTAVTGRSVIYLRKMMRIRCECTMDILARITRWQLGKSRGEGGRKVMLKMEGGIEQLTATHRPPWKVKARLTDKKTRDWPVRLMSFSWSSIRQVGLCTLRTEEE